MKIQVIEARKQKVWGWPAAVNFILGGAAASFYILNFLIIRLQGCSHSVSQPDMLPLLPPVLVGLGFVCLTAEVGRPLRAHQVFRRVWASSMSMEALSGAIFVSSAVVSWLFPHTALFVLAAAAATAFVISQGFIVYHARGVTAWNVPIIPLLFVTSSFATGGGLMVALRGVTSGLCIPLIGLICAFVNLVVWLFYLHRSHDPAFRKATESLRNPKSLIIPLGIGHLLPILVLSSIVVAHSVEIGMELPDIATAGMGLAMILAGAAQKADIILKAGFQREISLESQEMHAHLNERR